MRRPPATHRLGRWSTQRRVIAEWALVALAATVLVTFLALSRGTERADNVIFDTLSGLGVRAPHDDIVIVAIDNRSIAELGRWPWPRARHEALLEQLSQARPKAIAYDVLLVEPESTPGADEGLAAAIAAAAPVFLPLTFDIPGRDGAPYEALNPIAPLEAAAAAVGQVNVDFDADGVIRRAYLLERDGELRWPHLMSFMQAAALGEPLPGRAPQGTAPSGPLIREEPLLISFAGPPGHFRTISFADVAQGETPAAFLRDKLVLVGATADGLGDRYATPLSNHTEIMSGIELQANLLDTLLTGRAIRPAGPIQMVVFSLAPIMLALAGFLLFRPRVNLLLGAGLVATTVLASAALLVLARIWAPPTAALVGLLLVYPLWSWRRLEATSAYMLRELRTFSQEPDLLSALAQAPGGPPTDVIDRQVALMHAAIGRARSLRRLVLDALQGLPDATLVTSLGGRVLIANREAEALFGRDAGSAHRRVSDLISALAPDATPESLADLERAPPTDLELTAADGRTFHVRSTGLGEAGGHPLGWIVRFTDISALKAAGRQREHILELLTHDMRSPQVSILTLLGGSGPEALPGPLSDRIAGYARRTLSLADNFVNLARAEGDHYALETVNISDVLLDAVDDLWPQSSARKVSVDTSGSEEEFLVEADRTLLTRALINLVDNAIKYSPDGGRIDCALRLSTDGRRVICTITDEGEGMSPDQVASLFGRFQRARPKGGARIDGVGLGLSFVHAVVQRHGGSIGCASTPGQGATFEISLPLAAA